MEAMNTGLDDVHEQITDNADKTLSFLDTLIAKDANGNADKELLNNAKMPEVTNLKNLIFRLE